MKKQNMVFGILFVICIFLVSSSAVLQADGKKNMGGWGVSDPYHKFYRAQDVEKLKVIVVKIKEVVPLKGMSPGVALLVKEDDSEELMLVHLCPVWYKKASRIGIRKGNKITLRGYFAEINGQEVIMAAKIKNKQKTFKVRLTSDGTPFWTMSPGQLQKELSSD